MNQKQQSKELTSLKENYRAHLNSLIEIEDKACKLLNIDPNNSNEYDSDWVLDYLNGHCSQSVLRKKIKQ
jgi:hypothetical protein